MAWRSKDGGIMWLLHADETATGYAMMSLCIMRPVMVRRCTVENIRGRWLAVYKGNACSVTPSSFLRREGNNTIRPAPAVPAVTWCSKRERKCIWQVKLDANTSTHSDTHKHCGVHLTVCRDTPNTDLSFSSSGCEVWHPLCKQAARAERRLRVRQSLTWDCSNEMETLISSRCAFSPLCFCLLVSHSTDACQRRPSLHQAPQSALPAGLYV